MEIPGNHHRQGGEEEAVHVISIVTAPEFAGDKLHSKSNRIQESGSVGLTQMNSMNSGSCNIEMMDIDADGSIVGPTATADSCSCSCSCSGAGADAGAAVEAESMPSSCPIPISLKFVNVVYKVSVSSSSSSPSSYHHPTGRTKDDQKRTVPSAMSKLMEASGCNNICMHTILRRLGISKCDSDHDDDGGTDHKKVGTQLDDDNDDGYGSGSGTIVHDLEKIHSNKKIQKKKRIRRSSRNIIEGVSGHVLPGEMLALMGPSGSGKTTLLNLLSGRLKSTAAATAAQNDDCTCMINSTHHEQHQHRYRSMVTFNGLPYSSALKQRMGFVTQDDILHQHLTVKETLIYAALLRLPRKMSRTQKCERAMEVLHRLGLEKCQDTVIGGPFKRGISGGERKRVNVGHEILIDPSILFLDEPTSGLDSTTALRLVQILHDLAKAGRTVVTTIHQPSSRLFYMFDKLILLGEGGRVIYSGEAKRAMDYLSSIGISPLLPMVNPADFLLDLASGSHNMSDIALPLHLQQHLHALHSDCTDDNHQYKDHNINSMQPMIDERNNKAHHDVQQLEAGNIPSVATQEYSYSSNANTIRCPQYNSCCTNDLEDHPSSRTSCNDQYVANCSVGQDLHNLPDPKGSLLKYLFHSYETILRPFEEQKLFEDQTNIIANDTKYINDSASILSNDCGRRDWTRNILQMIRAPVRNYTGKEWSSSWWLQFTVLLGTGMKERRHDYLSLLQISQITAISFIIGSLWWQSSISTVKGLQDQVGLIFFISTYWGMFPLYNALFTFPQEKAILAKERASNMYRLSAYFMARILGDALLNLCLPTLFLIVVYFMAGLKPTASAFILTLVTTFATAISSQGLGLTLGAALMNVRKATSLASVILLTFMLAGGFFVQKLPAFIGWIKNISYNYYSFDILVKVQYDKAQTYNCDGASGCESIAGSPALHGIELGGASLQVCILLIMLMGYHILAYVFLRRMKLGV